jgi:hypothetical protein
MKRVIEHFDGSDGVGFVAVQTVFEGYDVNTVDQAKASTDEFDIHVPVGHDGGPDKSLLMRRYRTGGTPWIVIIDRDGTVRFNDFFIGPEAAISLIDQLLG